MIKLQCIQNTEQSYDIDGGRNSPNKENEGSTYSYSISYCKFTHHFPGFTCHSRWQIFSFRADSHVLATEAAAISYGFVRHHTLDGVLWAPHIISDVSNKSGTRLRVYNEPRRVQECQQLGQPTTVFATHSHFRQSPSHPQCASSQMHRSRQRKTLLIATILTVTIEGGRTATIMLSGVQNAIARSAPER